MCSDHQRYGTISITSGLFRGRKLITPIAPPLRISNTLSHASDDSLEMRQDHHPLITHPMGSREKLALFNTLESLRGPLTSATKILDLYCGSGALGLEALSRGAGTAVFVDQNPAAIRATRQNIAALDLEKRTIVLRAKLPTSVPPANLSVNSDPAPPTSSTSIPKPLTDQRFDLILIDPPYDAFPVSDTLSPLASLLASAGLLVLSHPSSVEPTPLFPNLRLLRTKSYAAANLSFFAAKS